VEQKPWEVDPKGWPDPVFMKNRVITFAISERYGGMYVAWSRDGTRIVEADADDAALYEKLRQAHVDLCDVVSYVDPPGVSLCPFENT